MQPPRENNMGLYAIVVAITAFVCGAAIWWLLG
jgi:hypothetical protein